ncbi:hypothetical protein [Streptomyces sp. NRRL S-237]|uniref:hypothetical protein n=1 Tax=Streptomyces sp. NRRL S-237 TaxID=1463895 RepID=UPI0004C7AB5B|nr:hypothetical protein [Streptomyces sp. NRRL S-237]
MSILKLTASSEEGAPRSTAAPTTAALLPLAVMLPAVTVMFHDRFGVAASVALVVVSLVLVAAGGALVARTTARAEAAAIRARRDAEVLDALEPLAGARR